MRFGKKSRKLFKPLKRQRAREFSRVLSNDLTKNTYDIVFWITINAGSTLFLHSLKIEELHD